MSNQKPTLGEKLADNVTAIIGSWKFIVIQSIILAVWLILNIFAWIKHWDPYPFILLNLMLSFQAAYAAPIIMMSQNRMSEKDRQKAERDFATNRKAEREVEDIQADLARIERKIDEIRHQGAGRS
jgi:uncharacterized membrane protein